MKSLSFVILFLISNQISSQVKHSYSKVNLDDIVFQDFDQKLMKLWLIGKRSNDANLFEKWNDCTPEWIFVKEELLKLDLLHIDIPDFIEDIDYYFNLLKTSIELEDYSNIERMSYHILYEFRSLRQCYFYSSYPLDQLWDVIDVYTEIDFTIDDPKMDLKEWFEFEDMVNTMICNWEGYDYLHISEVQEYFPGINKKRHSIVKEDINSCTFSLLIAIETALQDKFKLPCDQLGDAFEEMIQLYAYSQPSGLM